MYMPKYGMKIKVTCDVCGAEFERIKTEVNRSKKLGRRLFCSKRCCGKATISNIPTDIERYDISQHANNLQDEYSQFKWHLRNCHTRRIDRSKKGKTIREVTVTLDDLKTQWEAQDGKCPYTGWPLINLKNTNHSNQLPLTTDRASLDRKDSSKGYIPGNIQFVSYMAQCAKNKFEETDLLNFCESVSRNLSLTNSVSL